MRFLLMNYSTVLRALRRTFGLCLVMVAVASVAQGRTPAPPQPGVVPELDPGSVLSAMTMLGGGFMMITDRRRRAK